MDDSLNPAQAEAVNTLTGPLLVLAGAGTGKTRVVTFRIAKLIRHNVRPQRILAVTFTNKAAAEMQERAAALLKGRLREKPEISTFHSLCVRILRKHIRRLGYPETFAIYDRGDQEGVARSALRQIKVAGEVLRPADLLALISRWKSAAVRPNEAVAQADNDKFHLAALAYRRYQRELKLAAAVDFDDLLLLTEELFQKFPAARREVAQGYEHLLVDEYQDTNASQYRIVKALAAGHRNLCVVGDDDQSIYGWRGAEVTHILSFKRDWPEAKVVRLEENYRSTAAILEVANRLIAFNKQRHDKILRAGRSGGERPRILQLNDEELEAKEVVADIGRRLLEPGSEPRHFAILFRTNEQPRAFEMELRRVGLPYVLIGGMSFYDRKEVRDGLAYLKLACNPRDEVSLLRIINKPPRGIGPKVVKALSEAALGQGKTVWELLPAAAKAGVSQAAAAAAAQFCRFMEEFQQRAQKERPLQLVHDLISRVGYRRELERIYPNFDEQELRWNAIEELVNSLGRYQKRAAEPTLSGFLREVALAEREDEDDKESQLRRNSIALMTLHSAKGLEFPHVYMVGMEEGILPHRRSLEMGDEAIDEERRLCYVGLTRAQDHLTLSLALTRMKWGKSRGSTPSRYLYELSGKAERASSLPPRAAKPAAGRRSAKKPSGKRAVDLRGKQKSKP